jgi:hypothetical protein
VNTTTETTTDNPPTGRIVRAAKLGWVPIDMIQFSELAQRLTQPSKVNDMVAHFNPDLLGIPIVSQRDDYFWVIDGGHRVATCREVGWGYKDLQCQIYTGLTEQQEADLFLLYNKVLPVNSFDRFRIAVFAGWEDEVDIDRIVRLHDQRSCTEGCQGLHVTLEQVPGAISGVATLRRIYRRSAPKEALLRRTLDIAHPAYGESGLRAIVLDGLSHVMHRYGDLDDEVLTERLKEAPGGLNAVLTTANVIRYQTGKVKAQCVAAAISQQYNKVKGGRKLPEWWKA